MQLGIGISEGNDGKLNVILTAVDNDLQVSLALTDEEHYEHDIEQLISGFKTIKADMRRQKSGLTVVQEVPNAIRKPERRKLDLTGGKS